MLSTQDDLFHPVIELPEPVRQARYERLVGLDEVKGRLRKEAMLLADPDQLARWSNTHHGGPVAALALFEDRAPLFVFAGDVGAGKTALAESFGCDLAQALDVRVMLYRLKLSTRGSGLVGEMTTLIGDAFALLTAAGKKARTTAGINSVIVFVIDEADALAQSRASAQMHHEDRAGVDALLAGVDALAGARLPVIVVLCTNRARALDPAVMRRAAATFTFGRPDAQARRTVLTRALGGLGLGEQTVDQLVELTGAQDDRVGFTYSDLTQRLVPAAILEAFADRGVDEALLVDIAKRLEPTPQFNDEQP